MNDAPRGTIYQKRPTPGGDVTKLPKWAQSYIQALSQFLDGVERSKRFLEGEKLIGDPAAFVYLQGYTSEPIGANAYMRVEFPQPTKFDSRSHIDVSLRNGVVEVSGTRSIVIEPGASNVIGVRLRDD